MADIQFPSNMTYTQFINEINDAITARFNGTDSVYKSAGYHNSIADPDRNLMNYFSSYDELSTQIQKGDFSNIFPGAYIDQAITTTYGTNSIRWRVAGCDVYKRRGWKDSVTGNGEITKHHIMLIADSSGRAHKMNDTDTTTGGYKGSAMWTTVLPAYAIGIQNAFGSNHVLTYVNLITNSVNTAATSSGYTGLSVASNEYEWNDCVVDLPSEVQVCGGRVFSSSGYDIGIRNSQLPIFSLCPDLVCIRARWWLSSVAHSSAFCSVGHGGDANFDVASNSLILRPIFLFV